ncbi:MAG TPA: GntR family transcriptional regulator [Streptosporangiaceae bacterium]|jgi:GntR family transcriptional regulator
MTGPLYRQIADDLRHKIESGELKEGARLPTEDQLMELYHSSRNTVRGAIRELTTRGLVDTQHGRGTFVAEQVSLIVTTLTSDLRAGRGGGEGLAYTAEVAASGRTATTSGFRVEIREAVPSVARALRIVEGAQVVCRHESRYVDGRPWSLQDSYYPQTLLERAPRLLSMDAMPDGTVDYLAQCGIQQVGYRDAVDVRFPHDEETGYFGLPADGHVQVYEIYRVAFDQSGERIRLTVTVYRADRNRFIISVGDVPGSETLPQVEVAQIMPPDGAVPTIRSF